MDNKKLAQDILSLAGGKDNIISVTHCMTRLRFQLKNDTIADVEAIKKLKGVQGVVNKNGQFQIVIGTHVGKVCDELKKMGDFSDTISSNDLKETGIINQFLGTITAIFTPIIPALAGSGMIKAVLALLTVTGIIAGDSQTYILLSAFADAVFYFMPFVLAFSAAQRFKCSPYIAAALAGILFHPSFTGLNTGDAVSFFGLPVTMISYSGSVVPILLIVYVQSFVEKFAKKISHDAVKVFLVPMITIIVTGTIGIVIAGPLGNLVGQVIAIGFNAINDKAGWVIPFLMGTFCPFFIMTGMHYCFAPIQQLQYATLGYGTILGPGMLSSNIAQGTAAIVVGLKSKNKEMKQLGLSAGFTGLMGITEPALYGVTFKLRRPLYAAMIGGGAAGLYAGLTGIRTYASATAGLPALPVYISDDMSNLRNACITVVISIVVTAIATVVLGFKDEPEEGAEINPESSSGLKDKMPAMEKVKICAPMKGKAVPLSQVSDDVFSQEILGKGAAILPCEGKVYAPFDGTVATIFDTKHAFGLISDTGIELLIHVGINTVNLQGKYFTAHVKAGDKVKKGRLLLEFDKESIEKEGYETITPVIISNTDNYMDVIETELNEVTVTDTLITIIQ